MDATLASPMLVHARAGVPPSGVEDLAGGDGAALYPDSLVAAGQAMTWQATYVLGAHVAIPLTRASALTLRHPGRTGPEGWHGRFNQGLAHRMAVELTIASVTAGLLGERAVPQGGEDATMLGSAIDGLARLLTDLNEAGGREESRSRIVADAMRTHDVLLGGPASQRVSVRRREGFAVHTVRSVATGLDRSDLERVRARVGLPWPARAGQGLGEDLGLARWLATMQAHGHRMWSRLEGEADLVTELWLADPPAAAE
jgi:hypothetical protein